MRKSRAARLATQPEALHDRPGGHTVKVRYFTSDDYIPPALLRRVEFVDEAFVAGVWRPTGSIVDWQFGHDDSVDEITEGQARAFAPHAFD